MIVVGVVAGLLLIGALFLVLWAFYRYSDSWRDFVVEFMTGPVVLALTLVAELFDFSTDLAERILEDVGWRFSAPASVGFAVTLACQLVHPRTLADHGSWIMRSLMRSAPEHAEAWGSASESGGSLYS
jgi:fumarate reductase subunit C